MFFLRWVSSITSFNLADFNDDDYNLHSSKRVFSKLIFHPLALTRCLKITEKVSFNIASEASYAYIVNGQK